MQKLGQLPQLTDVASDQQVNGLQLNVDVDREKASRLNVLTQAIDDTLYDAFGQRQVSIIFTQLNQFRVILEVEPKFRESPDLLDKIYVKSSSGQPVPLSAFATMHVSNTPLSIPHQGQFPAATISFNLQSGSSLSHAIPAIQKAEREIGLPDTIATTFTGAAAEFRSSLTSEPLLILAAVVVIYIVLGVLYESYIHPITILSTLPSAGVGALLALLICRIDFSLVALIGIILLIGIVKKNAIMMIDFALDAERKEGTLAGGIDLSGVSAAFSPDHDDDSRGAAWRFAARPREWNRQRAAATARHFHRRRIVALAISHALHDAGNLSLPRSVWTLDEGTPSSR